MARPARASLTSRGNAIADQGHGGRATPTAHVGATSLENRVCSRASYCHAHGPLLGKAEAARLWGGAGVVRALPASVCSRLRLGERASSNRIFVAGIFQPPQGKRKIYVLLSLDLNGVEPQRVCGPDGPEGPGPGEARPPASLGPAFSFWSRIPTTRHWKPQRSAEHALVRFRRRSSPFGASRPLPSAPSPPRARGRPLQAHCC